MANLTDGVQMGNYTELLLDGMPVAARGNKTGKVYEICKRCGGSGHYSFNLMDGTVCYGCGGNRVTAETTEADVIRKAGARAKARARAAAKAEAKAAEARAIVETWQAEHAELMTALEPHRSRIDAEGYTDFDWRPVNNFLTSLADQAKYRPLSDKQIEAAWNALRKQAGWDAEKAAKAAKQNEAGHFGNVGEKVTAEVEIVNVHYFEGDWNRSSSFLVVMRTNEGHMLKTFSSGRFGHDAEKGQTVTITGTVKAHENYEGAPQTSLTRVKAV